VTTAVIKHKKHTGEDRVISVIVFLVLTIVTLVTLYPFWNIFVISINDATDAIRGGLYLFPRVFSLESYKTIFRDSEFMNSIRITVLRTVIGTPLAVLATAGLAFSLSRRDLVGRKFFNFAFIFTMYFGGGMIPYYMILLDTHLYDTFWVYIFPNLVSVYNMILVKAYVDSMPAEIFESARIDGANDLRIFWQMVLPLSKPILMTIALFVAIGHWNSWFDSYYFTDSSSLKTLQAVLVKILNQYQTSSLQPGASQNAARSVSPDSIRMAASMVATIPIILVYPFVQKYFVKGIMIGAVKS
jgi:putative aldouronate transport system permease protein